MYAIRAILVKELLNIWIWFRLQSRFTQIKVLLRIIQSGTIRLDQNCFAPVSGAAALKFSADSDYHERGNGDEDLDEGERILGTERESPKDEA